MPETIQLGVATHATEVSYINLYKHLENIDLVNEESFRKVFNEVQFTEEVGFEYNSLPLYVGWAYIPVVTDGFLEIKILKLEQGNGLAIILPEHVATAYKDLEEDLTKLGTYNANIDLVGDLYGLDEQDEELLDLIKKLYVNVGNRAEAFKLTPTGEKQKEDEEKQKGEEDMFSDTGGGAPYAGLESPGENIPFGDIDVGRETPVEESPEIEVNEAAYKRFSGGGKSFTQFLEELTKQTPLAVRKFISIKTLYEERILLVRVDNKQIYETFSTIPKHARTQISSVGELIRLNEATQLVDSFKDKDGRVFVLVENSHSNIWEVKGEIKKPFNEKTDKTLYISKKDDIIELEQSRVRQENRRFVPRIKDGKTVFSVK